MAWNPALVLNHLEGYLPNELLNTEKVTLRLVTLMALMTAHRVQTFALINTQNIQCFSDRVGIEIPDRIKTAGPNKFQPILLAVFD